MTNTEMLAKIAALEAQLAKKNEVKITVKASAFGGCSVYGLGRFPVTLFREQWERLLGHTAEIKAVCDALPVKGSAEAIAFAAKKAAFKAAEAAA